MGKAKKAAGKRWAYRDGFARPVPAQVVGDELARIETRDGRVKPAVVVDEARPEEAALHPCFEWDDEAAAEAHRRAQARQLIRCTYAVEVRPSGESSKRLNFVSHLDRETADRGYRSAGALMVEEQARADVLAEAITQLRAWRQRYAHLAELAGVLQAIDRIDLPA